MKIRREQLLVHGTWAIVTILVALGVGILTRQPPDQRAVSVTQLADPADVIGEDLMIALLQAKNFHRKAKVYMSDGRSAEAIAAVRQILSLQFPPGAPEAEDVRNDARALLAKLLVDQGQLDEAMRVVEEGLAAVTRESFFVANLHTVKGEIHYARASKLDQDPKADAEKRLAIDELDRSIQINMKLQKQLPEATVNGVARGLAIGLAFTACVVACMAKSAEAPPVKPPLVPQLPLELLKQYEKRNLINQLWIQIRDWRHDKGWELDPPRTLELTYRKMQVKEVRVVCPDGHTIPKVCSDTCTLAGQICDNAETICSIADELGKTDPAQEKCTSAKASCREAKQRCCDCEAKPPGDTPPP